MTQDEAVPPIICSCLIYMFKYIRAIDARYRTERRRMPTTNIAYWGKSNEQLVAGSLELVPSSGRLLMVPFYF